MLCINCNTAASWAFRPGGVRDQYYCDTHLPRAYRGLAEVEAYRTPAPDPVEPTVESTPDTVYEAPKPRARKRQAKAGQ